MRRPGFPMALRAGRFGYRRDGAVSWSGQTAALHGYDAGQVRPSLELLTSCLDPADRETFTAALNDGGQFCLRLRLTRADGGARIVVVLAEESDPGAESAGVRGFYIDLTGVLVAQHRELLDTELSAYAATRGVVEQAAGMLMLVYGIDAGKAHEILRWRAAETGRDVVALAQQLVAAAPETQAPAPLRDRLDDLLLDIATARANKRRRARRRRHPDRPDAE